jgi:hypothetical protein
VNARREQRLPDGQSLKRSHFDMEVRHTVRRFPGAAFALILGLIAALVVVMTLSIGGWGLAIPGPSSANTVTQPAAQSHPGSPAAETQPTTQAVVPYHQAGQPSGPGTP